MTCRSGPVPIPGDRPQRFRGDPPAAHPMTDQAGARSRAGPPALTSLSGHVSHDCKADSRVLALVAGARPPSPSPLRSTERGSSAPRPQRAAAAPTGGAAAAPRTLHEVAASTATGPGGGGPATAQARTTTSPSRSCRWPARTATRPGTQGQRLLEHAVELAPRDATALAGLGSLAISRHDFAGADRARPAGARARTRQPVRDGRDRRRQRRAGPLRRGPHGARADARAGPNLVVLLPRLVPARAARPRGRRPAGDGRGRPVRRAGPREHGLGAAAAGQPRLQPRPLRAMAARSTPRPSHLARLRPRPGRRARLEPRLGRLRRGRSPATARWSRATRCRRT